MIMKITPRFSSREIIDSTIRKDWFYFQNEAFILGQRMASYMQTYINANRHRRGGTGKLARAMQFEGHTGLGAISWGIGRISSLPSYWYVINYGKMITGQPFIPARGKFVPGSFEGSRPESALAGGVEKFNYNDGSGFGIFPGRPVRPINYIEATRHRLDANLRNLLIRIKGRK